MTHRVSRRAVSSRSKLDKRWSGSDQSRLRSPWPLPGRSDTGARPSSGQTRPPMCGQAHSGARSHTPTAAGSPWWPSSSTVTVRAHRVAQAHDPGAAPRRRSSPQKQGRGRLRGRGRGVSSPATAPARTALAPPHRSGHGQRQVRLVGPATGPMNTRGAPPVSTTKQTSAGGTAPTSRRRGAEFDERGSRPTKEAVSGCAKLRGRGETGRSTSSVGRPGVGTWPARISLTMPRKRCAADESGWPGELLGHDGSEHAHDARRGARSSARPPVSIVGVELGEGLPVLARRGG